MSVRDSRPRCYVASPLGFTEGGRSYYEKEFLPAIAKVVVPFDPWAIGREVDLLSLSVGDAMNLVGSRNAEAIANSSLLVAYLDGQELDCGTAAEVGYAAAKGVVCFGLRTDLRATGDLGASVNVQVEWFVRANGGSIVGSLSELVHALQMAGRRSSR
jgi:nucleoside 2-deoxyribosyltransferase